MLFTHVYIGAPGRLHDAHAFSNSGLEEILSSVPDNRHILGDSAYPMRMYLMRPHRDNGQLSNQQQNFNVRLSVTRSVIERAFAQVKGKFRHLKHFNISNHDMIRHFVMATCVLHNVILSSLQTNFLDEDGAEDCVPTEPSAVTTSAVAKRDRLATL